MSKLIELNAELNDLRLRSHSANKEQLEDLLNEARALLKKSFQTEHEEAGRQLFRDIRGRMEQNNSIDAKIDTSNGSVEQNADNSLSSAENVKLDMSDLMANARIKFYAGEYYDAISLLTEALRIDPNNHEARERLNRAEDNIRRGVVPDTRVPYEARVAFGRAQSLERAQRYDEARDLYKFALDEARKGGPELSNWAVALDALLRIDAEVIARQTRDQADLLMRQDKWQEAIEKYEVVLRLTDDDMKAQDNIKLLHKVQEQSEKARIQLATISGNLGDMARMIMELRENIKSLRPQLDESKLLANLESELDIKSKQLEVRVLEKANSLLMQAALTPTISERKRILLEAIKLLENVSPILHDDQVYEIYQTATSEMGKVIEVEKALVEARRFINENTERDARSAKDKLRELREFNQDPIFRQLATMLLHQYVDYAHDAFHIKRFDLASQWLSGAKDEPFRMLGRIEEIGYLEAEIERSRRQKYLIIAVVSLFALVLLTIFFGPYLADWLVHN